MVEGKKGKTGGILEERKETIYRKKVIARVSCWRIGMKGKKKKERKWEASVLCS